MPQKMPTLPLAALLQNNARPFDPLAFSADLLRNGPNLARIGGPKVPMVVPLGGRPMEAAMMEFIVYLSGHFYTTAADRRQAVDGTPPPRRPGQRTDLEAWMRSSAIVLKVAQAELSCHGADKIALVNRYLSLPGPLQNRQGIHIETLKDWRRKDSSQGAIWTKETAANLTALFLPPEIAQLDPRARRARLNGLREWIETLLKPYLDEPLQIAFFSMFLDFSQHSEGDLDKMIRRLAPRVATPLAVRLKAVEKGLKPALAAVADLLGEEPISFGALQLEGAPQANGGQ